MVKSIFAFLKDLNWIDHLMIISFAFFAVIYDFCSLKYLPNINAKKLPILYGFPLPNKTNISWINSGERGIFLMPLMIDIVFYFTIFLIFYWFIFRYVFYIRLRKRYFTPLFFGILFINLSPFILPQQGYSWTFIEYPLNLFNIEFNWFGNSN